MRLHDESRGANTPPTGAMPRFMGNWQTFIKVTLASAKQVSFLPTCPESQPKSKLTEMNRQNFKCKE